MQELEPLCAELLAYIIKVTTRYEIARRLNHLTITQVYAALTYYHANRQEIDEDIAAEQTAYEELAKQHYQATLA
ncbi:MULTISPECIES: hypothetical protein [Moorena]|uniref:DUF433 domain-containing protein n=1 Tax=unclassified Moorena TaxID=2683338 RepID=UPI001E63E8E6|nr:MULTISPECIES: hypothetical protein [Moorena]